MSEHLEAKIYLKNSRQLKPARMPESTNITKKKTRRWRFSLSTLLVLTTLVSISIAWYSISARKQRAAVAWVQELQGEVVYGHQIDENRRRRKIPIPPGPKWLRETLGIDYLDHVVSVSMSGLYELNLQSAEIDDIASLANLPKLETLDLAEAYDLANIEPLQNLTQMKWLDLSDTSVSDLNALAGMNQLETLSLEGTGVKDLRPLASLKRLKYLNISYIEASDLSTLLELVALEDLAINEGLVARDPVHFEQLKAQNPELKIYLQSD